MEENEIEGLGNFWLRWKRNRLSMMHLRFAALILSSLQFMHIRRRVGRRMHEARSFVRSNVYVRSTALVVVTECLV